ncbi:MAG TPA: GNAT family N-acetyltransferase [Pseudonocardiaceae bacterium]|nr:GNAT family N-acetyltransferase [Pseudonocardiaceae bacterium]
MSAYAVSVLHREWAADLTPARLYALLRLRVDVFVVEQECPYQELDDRDLEPDTRHFWISSDTDPEAPAAYLRLLTEPDGGYRIGRVCTARDARGKGLSRRLMEAALADIGDAESVLDAQVQVAGLYASFGYQPVGDEFVEDGIPHITMRRPAPTA